MKRATVIDLAFGAVLGAVCAAIGFCAGWAACDLSDGRVVRDDR